MLYNLLLYIFFAMFVIKFDYVSIYNYICKMTGYNMLYDIC